MPQAGEQAVPGYRLEKPLGSGSYGEVWKATGPGGVPCALKFINLGSNSGLKEFRSIGLVKKLRHPNLCPLSAVWLKDPDGNVLGEAETSSVAIRMGGSKQLIIAMGLGDKTLADRLRESPNGIPVAELMRYMDDAARGIDYLNKPEHDLGEGKKTSIIHCDIKPANLLVVAEGVQVCDYGVAKALGGGVRRTMGAGGTPAYAPAELLNNDPSPQTDQFSLAITYFELRTGRLPFDESRAMAAILLGQLDLNQLPASERAVIARATAAQPAKRFPNCREMVEALWVATGLRGGSQVVSQGSTVRNRPASAPDTGFELPALTDERAEAMTMAVSGPPLPPASRLTDRLQPGIELVPGYTLVRVLGQGGYGQVWEADSGGISYALKVVRDIRGKGRNEFEVLRKVARFKHENLVEIRGVWLLAQDGSRVPADRVGQPGVPEPVAVVMATNLAEKNLLNRLRECQQQGLPGIPPAELARYVDDAASALDYLNRKHGIQHRDVKPENLLLTDDKVQVSDFGLAKLLDGDGWAAHSSHSGVTQEYAAPELLADKKVSPQTDQYSLAVTYYTLRTGVLPYPADASTMGTIEARVRGDLDLSGVGEAEQAVLRRALSPRPDDRFSSCGELARMLGEAVNAPPPEPRSPRSTPQLPPTPPAKQTPPPDIRATIIPGVGTGMVQKTPVSDVEPVIDLVSSTPSFPPTETVRSWPGEKDTNRASGWRQEGIGRRTERSRETPTIGGEGSPSRDGPVATVAAPGKKRNTGALAAVAVGAVLLVAVVGAIAAAILSGGSGSGGQPSLAQLTAELTAEVDGLIEKGKFEDAERKLMAVEPQLDKAEARKLREKIAAAKEQARKEKLQRDRELAAQRERQERADGLANRIKSLIQAGPDPAKLNEAKRLIDELAALDPQQAENLRADVKAAEPRPADTPKGFNGAGTEATVPVKAEKVDKRVDEARDLFRKGEVAKGLDLLDAALRGANEPTREVAEPLRDAWAKAEKAAYRPGEAVKPFLAAFEPPTDAKVTPADRNDLKTYAMARLAAGIRKGIPELTAQTNWEQLAEACQEVVDYGNPRDPARPWVIACLNECWAELVLDQKKPKFLEPVAETTTDGYGRYAATVRKLGEDQKDAQQVALAADDAANVIEIELAADHPWATPFRFGRLARRLIDLVNPGRRLFRAADDDPRANFALPYKRQDADRVSRFLAAARDAAAKAPPGAGVDVGLINYELTLAEGCRRPEPDMARFAEAAEATAKGEYLKNKKLPPLALARFWVFHAKAVGDGDPSAELESRWKAFQLLARPDSERAAKYAYDEVVTKLFNETKNGVGRDRDPSRRVADRLADVAKAIHKNEKDWTAWKVMGDKSPTEEAIELLLVAHEAKLKANQVARAAEYAAEADRVAQEGKGLTAETRAAAFGANGWLQYDIGLQNDKSREDAWKKARDPLTRAIAAAPKDDARVWRWRYALGSIRALELVDIQDRVKLADAGVVAANLIREAEPFVRRAYDSKDPDEKAIADGYYLADKQTKRTVRVDLFAAFQAACRSGIEKDPKAAQAPVWRLMEEELEYCLRDKANMTAEERAKFVEAREALDRLAADARAALDRIDDPELKAAARETITRVTALPKLSR